MNSRVDISTIILSYNDREYLKNCLTAYLKSHNPPVRETIVVVNGSRDGTIEMLDSTFPGILLILNQTNAGVARARNQGIREARGEYVLFLDSDTEIDKEAIRILYEYMEQHPDVAIVAPKLINPDGTLQYSARRFPTPITFLLRGLGIGKKSRIMQKHLMQDEHMSAPRAVDWVMGACFLTRKEALTAIGNFDERYFFGYEDSDLCYRLQKGKWKVVYHPSAVALHHYQRRSAQGLFFNKLKWAHAWSAFRFFRKRYLSLNT